MCITAMEMIILGAAKEDTVAVAMEGRRVVMAAMAVILSMLKMVIKATVLSLAGVPFFFLAFTGTSITSFYVFSIHTFQIQFFCYYNNLNTVGREVLISLS
jgi:hypothetical protein